MRRVVHHAQGGPRSCRGWRTALRGSTALVGASLALATAAQAQTGPFLYVPNLNTNNVFVIDTTNHLITASAENKWLNGWSAAAIFEGEFSQVTTSYAGKGVVRYSW